MENDTLDKSVRRVLVVDDEEDLVRLVTFHLEKEGYRVHGASSGTGGLQYALEQQPDLVILDVMLPEMDGLEVCRRLRRDSRTSYIPVLMLSARRDELDRVLGLELGADDYMVKPFSVRELVARVRAMFRRLDQIRVTAENGRETEKVLKEGNVTLYPERYQVMVHEQPCSLTHKEFLLLHILMSNPGKVMTREILLDKVWGYETEIDTRTVDVHVRSLRQKVEEDPARPRLIETVRGVGYRLAGSPDRGA